MKVLFIGGSGNISSACTAEAIGCGMQVYHFNRGRSNLNYHKSDITLIQGDIESIYDRKSITKYAPFDVVVNFIAFTPDQVKQDVEFFKKITKQYIFISSATVYQKPPRNYIITEACPRENPYWEYSRNKIACEDILFRQSELNYTIIRPSYTYGNTWIPCAFTADIYNPIYRIKNQLPIISHGDGESLWVMTHSIDFARAFIKLFGNPKAFNNHFHITSDEVLTWNQIYQTMGEVIGIAPRLIHIPSNFISTQDQEWGEWLLGDKAYSSVFDNSKLRKAIGNWSADIKFYDGITKSINWFEEKEERKNIDKNVEKRIESILLKYLKS